MNLTPLHCVSGLRWNLCTHLVDDIRSFGSNCLDQSVQDGKISK
jgi:hypothetical protein